MKKKSSQITQKHHISYDPEWTAMITRTEHGITNKIGWHKPITKGFLKILLAYCLRNWDEAVEL